MPLIKPALLVPVSMAIMATLPGHLMRAGLLKSRWLEISTDLFFIFSFQIIKEMPPPPAEESEVSDQSLVQPEGQGGGVGWGGELSGLG